MFHPVSPVAAPVGLQTTLFGRVCQDGVTAGEVCRLLVTFCVFFYIADIAEAIESSNFVHRTVISSVSLGTTNYPEMDMVKVT